MRRRIIPYNRALTKRAQHLRRNPTRAERRLWIYLKGRQRCNYDFHRQKPLLSFIVDFFCCELFMAIEIDGPSHDKRAEYDRQREAALARYDVVILRFTNEQVMERVKDVLATIDDWIANHSPRE
jgi:very-short-patch-repair endonuclease